MTVKRYISVCLAALLLFCLASCGEGETVTDESLPIQTTIPPSDAVPAEVRTVRVSVTKSLGNSSVLQKLKKAFEQDTPYKVEFSSNNNSTAVSVAQSGMADLLWILSGTAADQFIEAGYGVSKQDIMSEYYVLAGPSDDPAGVRGCSSMKDAFLLISEENLTGFISRGDDSDLFFAERSALTASGLVVGSGNSWYYQTKTGMASSLMKADQKGSYILTDRETFLLLRDDISLEILIECRDLKNTYTLIDVNPETIETVNTDGATVFKEWLSGEHAVNIIENYGIAEYGHAVFGRN